MLLEKKFDLRGDRYWILATLEEAYFGVEMPLEYEKVKKLSESISTSTWERETTEDQISKIALLLENSPL